MSDSSKSGAIANVSEDQNATATTQVVELTDEQRALRCEELAKRMHSLTEAYIEALEPKGALLGWLALGRETIETAREKARLAPRTHSGASTWDANQWRVHCRRLKEDIQSRVAYRDLDISKFARMTVFIDQIKGIHPHADELGFHTVRRFFTDKTIIDFDDEQVIGSIRPEWATWCAEMVARLLDPTPALRPTLDFLAKSKEDQARQIESDKLAKLPDDERLKREQDKIASERRTARESALSALAQATDAALKTASITPIEIIDVISKNARDRKIELPRVGFMLDPSTATRVDLERFAKSLWDANRIVEIKMLHGMLANMLESFKEGSEKHQLAKTGTEG